MLQTSLVYDAIAEVPAGRVVTYKQLAEALLVRNPDLTITTPDLSRAIVNLLSREGQPVRHAGQILSTHRVVPDSLKLSGHIGSIRSLAKDKEQLLEAEGHTVHNGRLVSPQLHRFH